MESNFENQEVRLAVNAADAATMLGISKRSFERHVRRHVLVVYCGNRRLYPVYELAAYLRREAIRGLA